MCAVVFSVSPRSLSLLMNWVLLFVPGVCQVQIVSSQNFVNRSSSLNLKSVESCRKCIWSYTTPVVDSNPSRVRTHSKDLSSLLSSPLHPTLVLQLLATHAFVKAKTREPPPLQKKAPRAPARHQKKAQSSSHTIRRCPPFTRSAQNALSHDELGLLFANWNNITPGKSSSNRTRFAIGTGISSGMFFDNVLSAACASLRCTRSANSNMHNR